MCIDVEYDAKRDFVYLSNQRIRNSVKQISEKGKSVRSKSVQACGCHKSHKMDIWQLEAMKKKVQAC